MIKRTEILAREREIAEEAQGSLSRFANSYISSEEAFVDCVMRDHRTLQQGMFRLFVACIREWAKAYDEGRYDLRNEQTCKLCKRIVEKTDDLYLPFV